MATHRTINRFRRPFLAAALIMACFAPLLRGAEDGPAPAASEKKIAVFLSLGPLFFSDSGFRDVFGGAALYPEIKATYAFRGRIYIWAAAGAFSKTGTVPEMGDEADTNQTLVSLGAGLRGKLAGRVEYQAEVGLFHAWFSETALGLEESHGRIGWRIEGLALIPLTPVLSAGVSLGYLDARATINDVSIIVGGWKLGVVAGYRF